MDKKNKSLDGAGAGKPLDLCIGAYKQMLEFEKEGLREGKTQYDKKSRQIASELHKMEREMKCLDFSFLEVEKMNTQLENESFCLYIGFLKGE